MPSHRSVLNSMTAYLLAIVFLVASVLTFPEYEFELPLYQPNISWLNCPKDWTKFGENCIKVFPDRATFREASIVCRSFGSRLVRINSLNKNKFVGRTVLLNGSNIQDVWIEQCDKALTFTCELKACVTGEWRCGDGKCISESWRCDKTQDCGDASDELNCSQVKCGGQLTTPSSTFQTPNENGKYPSLVSCQWKLQAPVGQRIELKFMTFELEEYFDTVTIHDGPTTADSIIGTFSGSTVPAAIHSTTNFLVVTFNSDYNTEKAGFNATWTTVVRVCDEVLVASAQPQWITSPGYPDVYMGNLHCSWSISAPGDIISIQVLELDLGDGDQLQIYDGDSETSAVMAYFTGRNQNEILFTSGGSAYILLKTDLIGTGRGFNMTYQKGCDIKVTTGYGKISSPGFSSGHQYPPNLYCAVSRLDAQARDTTLLFHSFETEENWDFVEVYEVSEDLAMPSKSLLNISGLQKPRTVRSTTGQFVIHFTTDSSLAARGWTASFSFGCHDNGDLPAHLHASDNQSSYGSFIRYNCDTGYQIVGSQERYCDMDGEWKTMVPSCKYVYCGPVPSLKNGELINITSRYYEGLAFYRCNPGYTMSGVPRVTCLTSGWSRHPTCENLVCPKVPPLAGGRTLTPYQNYIHERVEFICNPGSRLVGYMYAECLTEGKWSHLVYPDQTTECVPVNEAVCPEVKVLHGNISLATPVKVNETIKVTCFPGYKLSVTSQSTITCNKSGEFYPEIPKCEDVDECKTMPMPCGSRHTCINTAGSFWCKCADGYQHSDLQDLYCEDINECEENNGSCEQVCENTAGSYMCLCNDGFRLYSSNESFVTDDRVLVPGKSCFVLCPAVNVKNVEDLHYTSHPIPDGSFLYPTSLWIQCPSNTVPDGPPLLHCQKDGSWSGNVTQCIEVYCEILLDLENGDLEYTSGRQLGSLVRFSCHQGYSLHGNQWRYCQRVNTGAQWTGQQPTCQAVDCGPPPSSANSNYTLRQTTYGSVVTYTCQQGYRLIGEPTRTCLASGLWSTNLILCVAVTCPAPPIPEYVSLVTASGVYGADSLVKFTCNKPGYSLADPYPLQCKLPPFEEYSPSISLPSHQMTLTVTLNSSAQHLQNCSLHYSLKLKNWLELVKTDLIAECTGLTYDSIKVKDAEIRIETDINRITINKTIVVSPTNLYLSTPVDDTCLTKIAARFKKNGDTFELQESDQCPQIPVPYGNIFVHEAQTKCEKGVEGILYGSDVCLYITKGPVTMVMLGVQLNTEAIPNLNCLKNLSGELQGRVQEAFNDLDLAILCQDSPNIVVTQSSGIMKVANKKIFIEIPFFVHDLTTWFSRVQMCSIHIKQVIRHQLSIILQSVSQIKNNGCPVFALEAGNYKELTLTLCRNGFQYHEPSGQCMFCGDCDIIPEAYITTPAPTTVSTVTTTSTVPTATTFLSTTVQPVTPSTSVLYSTGEFSSDATSTTIISIPSSTYSVQSSTSVRQTNETTAVSSTSLSSSTVELSASFSQITAMSTAKQSATSSTTTFSTSSAAVQTSSEAVVTKSTISANISSISTTRISTVDISESTAASTAISATTTKLLTDSSSTITIPISISSEITNTTLATAVTKTVTETSMQTTPGQTETTETMTPQPTTVIATSQKTSAVESSQQTVSTITPTTTTEMSTKQITETVLTQPVSPTTTQTVHISETTPKYDSSTAPMYTSSTTVNVTLETTSTAEKSVTISLSPTPVSISTTLSTEVSSETIKTTESINITELSTYNMTTGTISSIGTAETSRPLSDITTSTTWMSVSSVSTSAKLTTEATSQSLETVTGLSSKVTSSQTATPSVSSTLQLETSSAIITDPHTTETTEPYTTVTDFTETESTITSSTSSVTKQPEMSSTDSSSAFESLSVIVTDFSSTPSTSAGTTKSEISPTVSSLITASACKTEPPSGTDSSLSFIAITSPQTVTSSVSETDISYSLSVIVTSPQTLTSYVSETDISYSLSAIVTSPQTVTSSVSVTDISSSLSAIVTSPQTVTSSVSVTDISSSLSAIVTSPQTVTSSVSVTDISSSLLAIVTSPQTVTSSVSVTDISSSLSAIVTSPQTVTSSVSVTDISSSLSAIVTSPQTVTSSVSATDISSSLSAIVTSPQTVTSSVRVTDISSSLSAIVTSPQTVTSSVSVADISSSLSAIVTSSQLATSSESVTDISSSLSAIVTSPQTVTSSVRVTDISSSLSAIVTSSQIVTSSVSVTGISSSLLTSSTSTQTITSSSVTVTAFSSSSATTVVSTTSTATKLPETSAVTTTTTTTSAYTSSSTTTSSTPGTSSTSSTSTTAITTKSPLEDCYRTLSLEEMFLQPRLDYSKQQLQLWFNATVQSSTTSALCLSSYLSVIMDLIKDRELQINNQAKLKESCGAKGIYLKFNVTLKALSRNLMELLSVISLFAISGSTINTTTMGICASAVITYKELEVAACFLHVSTLKPLPSDRGLCESIPLQGVRLKSYNMTLGCSYGWRTSGKSLCEQEVTSSQVMSNAVFDEMVISEEVGGIKTEATSEGALTTLTTVISTTATTTTPTTTTTKAPVLLECFICTKATNNQECSNTFESCIQEDAVCQTDVNYASRKISSITKKCETRSNCELRRNSATCDPSAASPRCYYCCNTSHCNLHLIVLDFGGKGRRKRSDDDISIWSRHQRSLPESNLVGLWNGTVPRCIDTERPVFTCPNPIVVNGTRLPVALQIEIPGVTDNSGQEPVITVEPSNFTQPYIIYETTVITFTAVDAMKNSATCQVQILVQKSTTCANLTAPDSVSLSCKLSKGVCSASCKDGSMFVVPPADEYMCSNGEWLPTDFIPGCVDTELRACPVWKYTVTWTMIPDQLIEIGYDCGFTTAVNNTIKYALETGTTKVHVLAVLINKSHGKIQVSAGFSLTGVPDSCAELILSKLNNTYVTDTCNKSAILIDPVSSSVNKTCPEGHVFSNYNKAAGYCWPCPLGMEARTAICDPCPVGSYRDNMTYHSCLSCPVNMSTEHENSKSYLDCKGVCRPGQFSASGVVPCYSCPKNMYQPGTRSQKCLSCPTGTCTSTVAAQSVLDCSGTYCKSDPCTSQPCFNNGRCIEVANSYSCECLQGYHGDQCEYPYDLCSDDPCLYGNCVNNYRNNSFLCYCHAGFTGDRCSENIDDCKGHRCKNNGVCVDMIGSYVCNCSGTGFYGDFCEVKVTYCNHGNCMNGGQCVETDSGYSCACSKGFEGDLCENKLDRCSSSTLKNVCNVNGICIEDGQCLCKPGYIGTNCTISTRCDDSFCSNHGFCFHSDSGFSCHCWPNYTGEKCEEDVVYGCAGARCNITNTLECVSVDNTGFCVCQPEWTGAQCSVRIEYCQNAPCKNGGTCSNHGNSFLCQCAPGFAGVKCETNINDCASKPCLNGGTCQDGDNKFTCTCVPDWRGETCAVEVDACQSSPCLNGTCLDKVNGFECLCSSGWTGERCQSRVDPCLSLPCQNGGKCQSNTTGFICICPQDYSGDLCELEMGPCEPNPCYHGSTCHVIGETFTCTCLLGYHGDTCNENEASCIESVCRNGGTCVENGSKISCECLPRFHGPKCEKEKSGNFDLSLSSNKQVSCNVTVQSSKLLEVSVCLWFRWRMADGNILQIRNTNKTTLLSVNSSTLSLSFFPPNTLHVQFGITNHMWHQVCVTWSGSANGQWAVYFDGKLSKEGTGYGTGLTLDSFTVNVGSGESVQADVTGINVYSYIIGIKDLDLKTCYANNGNYGDRVSWQDFNSCARDLEVFSSPSSCPSTLCPPGFMGTNCDIIKDKVKPVIKSCPSDIVKVLFSRELWTEVSWSDPYFSDNTGIVDIKQSHHPGQLFTFGEYPVLYTAFDAQNNSVSCSFSIYVTSRDCSEPAPPRYGDLSCDQHGNNGLVCTVSCLNGYTFVEEVAQVYTCWPGGIWDPPRGKPFTLPPCASYSLPEVKYDGVLSLMGPPCSEEVKTELDRLLRSKFLQTGLCPGTDCDSANIQVACVLGSKMKRSAHSVQYNVTFNITTSRSTMSKAMLPSDLTVGVFENSLKGGLADFSVIEISMATHQSCDMGQVFSHELCVSCGPGYFHNMTASLCELCPQGTYTDTDKQTTCVACDPGKTTLTAGADSSTQCYSVCKAGYYRLDDECEPCKKGFYQDQLLATSCNPCPLGRTTEYTAATSQDMCNFTCNIAGMEMSVDGSCVLCPQGTYKEDRSEVSCTPCPYGYTTAGTGTRLASGCNLVKCSAGEMRSDNNSCKPCPPGSYQPAEGQDFCLRCPAGQITPAEGSSTNDDCVAADDPCEQGVHGCPESSQCKLTESSYTCECSVGYTMNNGKCIDNCENLCVNGICNKDVSGNPQCRCNSRYTGFNCQEKIQEGLSTAAIAGIAVGPVLALFLLAVGIFFCTKRRVDKQGEKLRKRFPLHRSDIRSSFRAVALALSPRRYVIRSTRSSSSATGNGHRSRSRLSEVENISNSSSRLTKVSYF